MNFTYSMLFQTYKKLLNYDEQAVMADEPDEITRQTLVARSLQ